MAVAPYILGLDLGTASVGWAVLRCKAEEDNTEAVAFAKDPLILEPMAEEMQGVALEPTGIIKTGVRLFELMGGSTADEYREGKDASPAEARREARLMRRQHRRRGKRRQRILTLMQLHGLLPQGDIKDLEARTRYFADLDAELRSAWFATRPVDAHLRSDPDFLHIFPYKLRGAGITEPLWPFAFGRALYHLSQRRGFQSNRKDEAMLQAIEDTPAKGREVSDEEKELGVVKKNILNLEEKMCAANAMTVGQYLAGLSPSQTRIRNRFTSRAMITKEFDVLWERQRELQQKAAAEGKYPAWLRDSVKNALHKAIFYQRPLKSQKNLVGKCSLEKEEHRASWNCVEAQEFRLLQKLNDLRWFDTSLTEHCITDTPEHRQILLQNMMCSASLSFPDMRRLLKLPKSSWFNFEQGDEKGKLPGHKMNARMMDAFGHDWSSFSPEKQEAILHDVLSIQKPETLKKRGMTVWGLDEKHARKLARGFIDEGYCDLSKKALSRLLPGMREGVSYGSLRPEVYPLFADGKEGVDMLPPVLEVLDTLRNPAVIRCLTEARKVVNALIREYGKPAAIRIELARDMKNSRDKRDKIAKRNKQQEKLRDKARAKLETFMSNPSGADIEKLLLAEECGWRCPYTSGQITIGNLFLKPEVEVEHILPYSRTFDNSFANKTLCFSSFNKIKGNKIPYEAVKGQDEYAQMLERVKAFHSPDSLGRSQLGLDAKSFPNGGHLRKAKLERFMAQDLKKYEGFTSRQLNDTRHASRVALEFMSMLYGQREALRRVQVGRGGVTSILRGVWRLNEILGDGGEKSRDDHRHHAVDAIAIACTSRSLMKNLQDVAARQEAEGIARLRLRGKLAAPWERFLEDARQSVHSIVPSWRISHRARGPLHKETNYAVRTHPETGQEVVGYRVKVGGIGKGRPTDKDIDAFAEKMLSRQWEEALRNQLFAEMKSQDKKNAEAEDASRAAGKIRAVRVEQPAGTLLPIGKCQTRLCQSAANHHATLFAVQEKGKEKWVSPGPVTLFEVVQRVQRKEPMVDEKAVADGRFLFTLASGDCIRVMVKDVEEFLKVRTVYLNRGNLLLECTRLSDARTKDAIKKAKEYFSLSLGQLQKGGCHKILVLPSGEVVSSHG